MKCVPVTIEAVGRLVHTMPARLRWRWMDRQQAVLITPRGVRWRLAFVRDPQKKRGWHLERLEGAN